MTSTRSRVVAGMRRRSTPPPAAEACGTTSPRTPTVWRLALLESGTPSSTMSVPAAPISAAPGPETPPTPTEPACASARSENCPGASSPGGWSGTPGTSSSTPASELATWLAMASRSMTLAVPSSPVARPVRSAVTTSWSSCRELRAMRTVMVTAPAAGTVTAVRLTA